MFTIQNVEDRYKARCIVKQENTKIRPFVIDTGAKYTCCSFDYINPDLKEEDFAECKTKYLGGFVANVGMKFYECKLKQFTVGTADLGEQTIWITFDPRIADSLLGMDIISQVLFLNNPKDRCLIVYDNMDELVSSL